MLGVVGSNLKMAKFFMQYLWMLHVVVAVLAGFVQQCCTRACALLCFFNTQHVATCRNRVAKRTRHLWPNSVAICCAEMLRSFGRGLRARESSPTPKNIGRGERPLLRVCHETTARQGSCLVTERCETFSEEFDCYKALFNCKSSLYFVFRRCIFKVTTSN